MRQSFLKGSTDAAQGNIVNMFSSTNSYVDSGVTYSNTSLLLQSTDGTRFNIKFKKEASGTYTYSTNGSLVFGINPTGTLTAVGLAGNLVSLITGETSLNAKFSATVVDSQASNESGAVKITQKATGPDGANNTPHFNNPTSGFYSPMVTDFVGGTIATKRSAGDKAMDLYGLSNNMKKTGPWKKVAGAGMFVGGVAGAIATSPTGVGIGVGAGVATAGVGMMLEGHGYGSDYIVGLQIPYNSSIQANGETYVARNFFMPTGWGETRTSKGSEGNTNLASADLTKLGNRAGIKGVMNKLDIQYEAGQNVYNFVLHFIPVDRSI